MPWSVAWRRSASGPDGFYRSVRGRAEDHFTTAVMEHDHVAREVVAIATPTMHTLASTGVRLAVTDVGAADGTLLRQLMRVWPDELREITDWRGIDLRDRPRDLDPAVTWIAGDIMEVAARIEAAPGLVVAHELLDDVPCDVVEPDDDGALRLVLVDPSSGHESIGYAPSDEIRQWCAAWWPRAEPAARIEVGLQRDAAWVAIRSLVTEGMAIAIDYGHVLPDRAAGRWDGGTLAGYLDRRSTRPVPDGSCNISAHVALDACAAAAPAAHTSLRPSGRADDFWWLVQSTSPQTKQ